MDDERKDAATGAGCLLYVAVAAASVGFGIANGPAYGFLFLAACCALMALAAAWRMRSL